MSTGDNFGKNRNKYRRVYGYGLSRRPEMLTFLDPISNENKTVDSQKFIRDRDFFHIPGFIPTGSVHLGEYIEDKIAFTGGESIAVVFGTSFTGLPVVTLETSQSNFTSDGSADPNIIAWVTNVTLNGFSIGLSAPFSGSVLYRAAYSPTYPVMVERKPLFPGLFGTISAGTANFAFQNAVTMSWNALASTPQIVDTTASGSSSDTNLDFAITQGVSGSSSVTADLSTAYSGTIGFIAIQ